MISHFPFEAEAAVGLKSPAKPRAPSAADSSAETDTVPSRPGVVVGRQAWRPPGCTCQELKHRKIVLI